MQMYNRVPYMGALEATVWTLQSVVAVSTSVGGISAVGLDRWRQIVAKINDLPLVMPSAPGSSIEVVALIAVAKALIRKLPHVGVVARISLVGALSGILNALSDEITANGGLPMPWTEGDTGDDDDDAGGGAVPSDVPSPSNDGPSNDGGNNEVPV